MYGEVMAHVLGRITKTPEKRTNADGKSYCFFTVVVNTRSYPTKDGGKSEPEALYYDLAADGITADIICNSAQKGSVFSGWVSIRPQKPREVTGKDGTVKVYHSMRMTVQPRHFDIINNAEKKAEDNTPVEATPVRQQATTAYAAPAATPAPANDFLDDFQMPDANDEDADAALENEIISQLPY